MSDEKSQTIAAKEFDSTDEAEISFMTKEQFQEEAYSMMGYFGHQLYIEATEVFVVELQRVLQKNTDSETLKNDILAICADRKDFIDSAKSFVP